MRIEFQPGAEYLKVILEGVWNASEARRAVGELAALSKQHGATRVLIDGRGISTVIPIADRHELGTAFAGAAARLRIGVAVSEENMFTKTFEDTATNRGMSLRTTTSLEEAVAFLKG